MVIAPSKLERALTDPLKAGELRIDHAGGQTRAAREAAQRPRQMSQRVILCCDVHGVAQ